MLSSGHILDGGSNPHGTSSRISPERGSKKDDKCLKTKVEGHQRECEKSGSKGTPFSLWDFANIIFMNFVPSLDFSVFIQNSNGAASDNELSLLANVALCSQTTTITQLYPPAETDALSEL